LKTKYDSHANVLLVERVFHQVALSLKGFSNDKVLAIDQMQVGSSEGQCTIDFLHVRFSLWWHK